ncbi:MAG: undecaprenyl/decaprenyl-phosphate alpha-N-acetylglucosaminyl 1-phosphate transferase [Streptococcaceae bacterium]|jgi:UDP-GlcNAc:undecaprenyl-phosphate GlcNAc-1-phosphate transferase|nr:undecaprenyl/decaprenyl-phosphate alpha-N-acetylglucosaminyl 1-phosphate transferase [Streptococcaceae bacterium]
MTQFIHLSFKFQFIAIFGVTFVCTLILTPLVRILARKIGAVDVPNARRINTKPMPSAGGLAIFIAFALATLVFLPPLIKTVIPTGPWHHAQGLLHYINYVLPLVVAGGIVLITGLIDDIKELHPLGKIAGIFLAFLVIWFFTDTHFDNFKIPFHGPFLQFPSWLSFIVTFVWIVLITNAFNIIDGLDGLASGVSIISLTTMGIVSYFFLPVPNVFLPITIFVLVAAIAGFFPYNYNPAVIYLGDTGALFIGFMLSVLSLQGLKNATAVATVTPLIILGVPLTDSVVATIRRTLNRQKFYLPDKSHLHHRLLQMGFTQRGAVFVIYGIASTFAALSIILNVLPRVGGILLVVALLFGLEIFIELVGIWGKGRHPIMNIFKFMGNSEYRNNIIAKYRKKS